MAVWHKFGLAPDAHQFVFKLGDEFNDFVGKCHESLHLCQAGFLSDGRVVFVWLKDILEQPQVNLLAKESADILIN